ncbi:hypothetical protein ACJJTC_002543 [Scirpophaga incertulas]
MTHCEYFESKAIELRWYQRGQRFLSLASKTSRIAFRNAKLHDNRRVRRGAAQKYAYAHRFPQRHCFVSHAAAPLRGRGPLSIRRHGPRQPQPMIEMTMSPADIRREQ